MNESESLIGVWLAEDNAEFRRVVSRALSRMPGLKCAATFPRGDAVIEALGDAPPPQVLLLDLGLPGASGFEVLAAFRERAPQTRVLVLTVFEDEVKIVRAICAGAAGYLLKSATAPEIARAIRDTYEGGAPITPSIARKLFEHMARTDGRREETFAPVSPAPTADVEFDEALLSPREKQILQLIVEGKSNKEISTALEVSGHTVDFHLRGLYAKLHVKSRSEAVAKAFKRKML